ncbi:TetR/AcrR family transcriptional regulator [Nocardioides sp.]|uniref:TetR/AcrR family transcriptional regulator n=1 Tax=Nocardioides sp. TaxID=35761 RepID=UPI00351987E6
MSTSRVAAPADPSPERPAERPVDRTPERAPRRAPVQARSRRKVEALLDAAESAVLDHGVEALTTREIAQRAGVPVATLYQYFADKEDLLLALVERHTAEMDEQVAHDVGAVTEAGRLTIASLVDAVLDAFTAVYRRRPAFVEIYLRGRTNLAVHASGRAHNREVAATLRALAVAEGLTGPDLPEQAAVLAVEIGDRMFQLAYEHDLAGDPAIIAQGRLMLTSYLERFAR